MSDTQPDINQMKEVEFYAANLNAWFNTRFEHDKSLLALSAGAVGLLITLISTVGVKSVETLILYILSLACFVVCLGALLWIFRRNAKHLEDVVRETAIDDQLLNTLDRVAVSSFMFGVVLSSIIGISTAINSYIDEASEMTDKTKNQGTVFVKDSVSGITSMRPNNEPATSSVSGITNMKPAAPQPSAAPAKGVDDKK
ncbi:hypothetical protein NAU58_20250 [Pseudomonas stutzeri]|uniref:hypothetical protein n=2 Tax=Stutzerimonas stutzeri TaxID=316 RepID=UPI0011AF7571|nr:hypothetical protein [Stutzerimonas stutzeri]MCQ4297911.1 hypothetical protein [Stutzerimonas stutzeri]